MTVARHYVMTAAVGQEEALGDALRVLAAAVRPIEGCEGCELLQDVDQPARFIFIEKWASVEAHKAGGALLPKETFKPVMAALAGPPEGAYLDYQLTV